MKANTYKGESPDSLNTSLMDLLKEQFNLRMQHATSQLGTSHQLKQVRRNIARVKTEISNLKNKGAE